VPYFYTPKAISGFVTNGKNKLRKLVVPPKQKFSFSSSRSADVKDEGLTSMMCSVTNEINKIILEIRT